MALGGAAGAVGTAAMDVVQFARHRRSGGGGSFLEWEFGGVHGWDDVSAPGQVAKMALAVVARRDPPDRWAAPAQALTHWATGAVWGATLGLATTVRPMGWCSSGPLLGLKAWLTAYLVLPPLGVYRPIWDYDVKTLAPDLGVHLVYGTTTAAFYDVLRHHSAAR